MKILVADDDAVSRRLLEGMLSGSGDDVVLASDGQEAWEVLQTEAPPAMALLDRQMPHLSGVEVCRKVRETPALTLVYVILVTSMDRKEDVVEGLDAGANDYVTKPFDRDELRARVEVGRRVVELQSSLDARVRELEAALAHVQRLQGIIPICCYCKKIRNDAKFWQRVEDYLTQHSEADFSHGICPECWDSVIRPQMEEMWGESVPYEES